MKTKRLRRMQLDLVATCGERGSLSCESSRTKACSCQCGGINHGRRMRDKRRSAFFPYTDPRTFDPTVVVPSFRLLKRHGTTIDIIMRRKGQDNLVNVAQALVVFSPCGFDWGNASHASAELALNILRIFVDAPSAWCMQAQYKRQLIATLPQEGAIIRPYMVRDWIDKWKRSPHGRKTVANYKHFHQEGS